MSIVDNDRASLPDEAHAVELPGGYTATLVVTPDGSTRAFLVQRDNPLNVGGCGCPDCVPHEQLGPLPGEYRDLLTPAPQCGHPRLDGEPCRALVPAEGTPCRWHRTTPATQEPLW